MTGRLNGGTAPVLDALMPTLGGQGGPVELAALVRDTVAAGVERQALHLRIGRIAAARRPQHRRALLEAVQPLRRSARLRVYDLPNGDVVAVGAPPAHPIGQVHATLLGMLGAEAAEGLALLRLPQEAATLLGAVEEALGFTAATTPAPEAAPAGPPLDGAALAQAERALGSGDLGAYLRRQVVCRLAPGDGPMEPCWEDRRVSLKLLAEALLPGLDLGAAPWLARRLRRQVDRRLLAELGRADEMKSVRALSLPLTVPTLTSPEFLRFDAQLPVAVRGGLTICVSAAEVLADAAAFAFARDFLRSRGHRVALDEATAGAAALLPALRGGFDLVRLRWTPGLAALREEDLAKLRAALPSEPGRVVLAEVDRPAAIAWGWEAGITLFQGRLIEQRRRSA